MRETVTLSRDISVIQIPDGVSARLSAGSDVVVMQTLGGNITVYATDGRMYRIEARDADAIGREAPVTAAASSNAEPATLEDRIWAELKTCYDPEIPVNIVDLGLIYHCEVAPLGSDPSSGSRVDIRMTLTAPGCGMGQVLKDDVERKVKALPEVREIYVELVFDPAWDQEMMSEAARLQLGML